MSKTGLLFWVVEVLSSPAAKMIAKGLALWLGIDAVFVLFLILRSWKSGRWKK
mgnify:CR=1 FL=1